VAVDVLVALGVSIEHRYFVVQPELGDLRRAAGDKRGEASALRNMGVNQKGEPVISFLSVAFVERRPVKGAA